MRRLTYVLVALLVVRVVRAAYLGVRGTIRTRYEDDDVVLGDEIDDEIDDDDDDDEVPESNLSHGYVPAFPVR